MTGGKEGSRGVTCADPSLAPPAPPPEAWVEKPSFGKPLEEHLSISGREIAFPIEACVTMLLECGMQEEVRLGAAELLREQISSPTIWSLWGLCSSVTILTRPHKPKPGKTQYKPPVLKLVLPLPRAFLLQGQWRIVGHDTLP